MLRFVFASLTPVVLIVAACLVGGVWPALALAYMTVFVALADRLGPEALPEIEGGERAANRLSVALGFAHMLLLPLGVRAIAAGPVLGPAGAVATGLALGLFLGQVSHPNAHELIHRSSRGLRRLGVAVYVTLLFGHHASAHPKVHHVHVATERDPNSAYLGEGIYRFFLRAWVGSFRAGLRAETAARARRAGGARGLHPYVIYLGGAAVTLALAGVLAGGPGVAVLLALCAYAQAQLLLADYVQHYGLRRGVGADGRIAPAGAQHSWNAPQWYSSALMLNAPRHSDHHQNPGRAFPALRLDPERMPILPRSMPVMAVIALVPPLWRRVMDRRARGWADGKAPPGR
ncbi:alkane 1-monooxygenase [Antarcticimicrobium sediminis]|uniref:Alkane 1-monooxygenase n=1 Tax=Antarcticimicrobium sediminis TaxID=2546227 RepID=A0A4V2Z8F3_9RHOB|nr:alkane 1-monooxygenase [Antarcticimicrobium sediminis]TDE40156.1 alkane 1-monooxygenase [Antarcticimicrobium sediminis]